jgi:hypothetical protein
MSEIELANSHVGSPSTPTNGRSKRRRTYEIIDPRSPDEEKAEVPEIPDSLMGTPKPGTPRRRLSLSTIDINVEDINKSLAAVNNFQTIRERSKPILLYEITADGESTYKSMSLRELLIYINERTFTIDEEFFHGLQQQLNTNTTDDISPPESTKTAGSVFSDKSLSEGGGPSDILSNRSAPARLEMEKLRSSVSRRRGSLVPQQSINRKDASLLSRPTGTQTNSSGTNLPTTKLDVQQQQQQLKERPQPIRRKSSIQRSAPTSTAFNFHEYNPFRDYVDVRGMVDSEPIKPFRLRDLRRFDTESSLMNETDVVVRRHCVAFALVKTRIFSSLFCFLNDMVGIGSDSRDYYGEAPLVGSSGWSRFIDFDFGSIYERFLFFPSPSF